MQRFHLIIMSDSWPDFSDPPWESHVGTDGTEWDRSGWQDFKFKSWKKGLVEMNYIVVTEVLTDQGTVATVQVINPAAGSRQPPVEDYEQDNWQDDAGGTGAAGNGTGTWTGMAPQTFQRYGDGTSAAGPYSYHP